MLVPGQSCLQVGSLSPSNDFLGETNGKSNEVYGGEQQQKHTREFNEAYQFCDYLNVDSVP
jgi:hypothetical protein